MCKHWGSYSYCDTYSPYKPCTPYRRGQSQNTTPRSLQDNCMLCRTHYWWYRLRSPMGKEGLCPQDIRLV